MKILSISIRAYHMETVNQITRSKSDFRPVFRLPDVWEIGVNHRKITDMLINGYYDDRLVLFRTSGKVVQTKGTRFHTHFQYKLKD